MAAFKNFRSALVSLSLVRRCAVLEMNNGENRFNTEFINHLNRALDEVESSDEVDSLVTIGKGKFFSNGLDIPFVLSTGKDNVAVFMREYSNLMARFLAFPMPTAAIMNGHAYAGGAILAMVHDYRFMRRDKGWLCLNEVRLRMRFPPGLCTLLSMKVSLKQALADFVIFGRKYTGPDALKHQLVDGVYEQSALIDKSIQFLEDLVGNEQFDKAAVRTMKIDLYKGALVDMTRDFTFDELELASPLSKF